MSRSTQALLLIRLDARPQEFVGVDELAAHYGLSPDLVRAELNALWNEGFVQCLLESTASGGRIMGAMPMRCEGQPCA